MPFFQKENRLDYDNSTVLKEQNCDIPFPAIKKADFRFIDLFCGIGGFRIAFQNLGGKCVFSSDIDEYAGQTYFANFGEHPFGDIENIPLGLIPYHDILLAGFPCQAFSIAGKKKGFDDNRGILFRHIVRILNAKQPKAFLLENVKGLLNHNKGKTINHILTELQNAGYEVGYPQIVNSKDFNLPQNRLRIYIAGFRKNLYCRDFKFPKTLKLTQTVKDIVEKKPVSVKYYLSQQYFETLKNHKIRHRTKGHGFGYEILKDDGIANVLVSSSMGRERNLIYDDRLADFTPVTNIKGEVNKEYIRRLTPREWARLQGFPDKFIIPVSDTQAYKQFGNTVPISVVQEIGKEMLKVLYR